MRKFIFLFVFGFLVFGVFGRAAFAQVNSDNVGPELADPSAGTNVIEKNGFTGTAAVINSLRDVNHPDSPHNTAHGARVVLRVDVDANTAQTPSVAVNYANQLNNSSEFPDGTLIVLGVELNNLDQQGWNGARTGNTQNDLARAAKSYADLYNAFSQVIHQKGKYRVAPAPPDLYNAVYDPVFWVQVFSSNVNCGLVDTLAADVFDVRPATGIGTVNLETWKYLEEHVCTQKRLKVTHFEGWGTDPKASIKDQIDFLKNHSFPEGSVVQTATSLIVNNCAGFGGNTGGASAPVSPWLYWIPKFPDKVFKADGSEFDYINCKDTNATTTKTYEVKDVPCNQTTDPEFHSLRPYPASPCKKEVSETALMCGNDLIVKHTFTATPTEVLNKKDCSIKCNGDTCTFTCPGNTAQIGINLKDSELPILGNTEDVPNATWTSANTNASNLTAAQRMNEYVSWYLNGVINRAEEDFSAYDPKYLVNYSGPIRKLLPWAVQTVTRMHSIDDAAVSLTATDPRDQVRHNQIVGCPVAEGGAVVPCYLYNKDFLFNFLLDAAFPGIDPAGRSIIESTVIKLENRLEGFQSKEPPLESNYPNFSSYWKAYSQWMGKICTPELFGTRFYFCADASANFWSKLFSYVPFSSTEDRVGQVLTDNNNAKGELEHTIQLKDGQGNGGTVSNVSFTPISDNHSIYLAHTEEDAQLAKLLQGTFATKGDVSDKNSWEGQLHAAIANQESASKYETFGCVPQEIRSNPGDNLYGDIDRGNDKKITGTLKYDATFTCVFKTDQQCIANCNTNKPGDQKCLDSCTNVCNKDIYTSLAVYTKTPKVFEIWQRLVGCDPSQANCRDSGGTMGIFKRFFPQAGADSVLTEIKDIPASSQVTYTSSDEARAGTTGKQGTEAQIFFPHVGSLDEYFLKGIQKALRPKGFTSEVLAGEPAPSSSGSTTSTNNFATIACPANRALPVPPTASTNNCQINCRNVADSQIPAVYLGDMKGTTISLANNWVGGRGKNNAALCYNDVVKRSLDAGVNPIFSLAIWIHESGASNYELSVGCKVQDFGYNIPSLASDFDSQIKAFLRLPYRYVYDVAPQCFQKECSMEQFSRLYQNAGGGDLCTPNDKAVAYTESIKNIAKIIAPDCDFPRYPTEITCK